MSYRTYLDIFCENVEYLTLNTTFMLKVHNREPRHARFGILAHSGTTFTVTYDDNSVETFPVDDDTVQLHIITIGDAVVPYYIR